MYAIQQSKRWFSTLLTGLAAVAFLFVTSTVQAQTESPKAFIERQTEEVTELLAEEESEERAEKFSQKAQEVIDFEMLASRALKGYWENRTEEQQKEFLTHLQELLEANYKRKLEGQKVGEDYQIEYLNVRQRDDRAFVKTMVKWGETKKEQKPVSYKLTKQGGDWIIYDVVIDDISLEQTYRESYTEIIKDAETEEKGWNNLIAKMKKKIQELRKKAEAKKGKKGK